MGITSQDFDNDNENSKSVEIPKDFYEASFKESNAYKKDGEPRLALIFELDYEGETVEVGRFLTAKATTYSEQLKQDSDTTDSDLGSIFDRICMLEDLEAEISARLQAADWYDDEVPEGFMVESEGGFNAVNEDEAELLADAVEAQLDGKRFRVLIVSPDGNGGSLIEDVDSLIEEDPSESAESSDGGEDVEDSDGEEEVIFDDDKEEKEDS